MGQLELAELQRRKRDQMLRLMEVSDLTSQLIVAAERRDQVSIQMLLDMRDAPLQQLMELDGLIETYLLQLPQETAARLHELLLGAEPENPEEIPLTEQVVKYRRLLDSTINDDKRLSLQIGGNRSFYQTFRDS